MGKYLYYILFFISSFSVWAQELKYPSLLWEVKKENARPSYLYGTMHVSEKIAFHLSDAFFDKIVSTDHIALESNPESWLEDLQKEPGNFSTGFNPYRMFFYYNSFQRLPIKNEEIKGALVINNLILNGILYRSLQTSTNYQENTYLDMFIYQIAKRTHRKVISLEDFKHSRNLIEKATLSNYTFDPPAWAKRLIREKPLQTLLEDAYRDKNLDMIDSISRGFFSQQYNQYMLTERNDIMLRSLDSILSKGQTVFAGVGAAHLPGNNGLIEKLRTKGYSVNPILGDYTDKGKNKKDEFDQLFQTINYTIHSTSDEIISLPTATNLYEFNVNDTRVHTSPDLINASSININRIFKYDFLRKYPYISDLTKIDSLLYEYIPGTITKKGKRKIDGFDAYEINNTTKEGDTQKNLIISTPIEYIIVSMIGKSNFIQNQGDKILKNISLKKISSDWKSTQTKRGGYKVNLPEYHTISANDQYSMMSDSPEIVAYDPTDQSYYFILENTVNDIYYLENTEFELKRIQFEFYNKLKLDSINGKLDLSKNSYTSEALIHSNKKLRLKSIIDGTRYYLLGSVASENKSKKFFESFQITPFNYYNSPVEFRDSILNYTTKTTLKPSKSEVDYDYFKPQSNRNTFEGYIKERVISSENQQEITVAYLKFPRYEYLESIDSLWNKILHNNKKEKNFSHKILKKYKDKSQNEILEVLFTKENCSQVIKAKYIANQFGYHSLKTVVSNDYKHDDLFIENFYNNFVPQDQYNCLSVFKRKTNYFIRDLKSDSDSIRLGALRSINQLKFNREDFDSIKNLIENFNFRDSELNYKYDLISKFGEINHPQTNSFLKNYYTQNSDDSQLQLAVIKAFSQIDQEDNYQQIFELFDQDIPLPSNSTEFISIFDPLLEQPKLATKFANRLFKYRSIPEYQPYVINLTAKLVDSGYLSKRKIKPYKKELLTQARLELKRVKTNWSMSKINSTIDYSNYISIELLDDYITLLQNFSDEKDVKQFLENIESLNIPELTLHRLKYNLTTNELAAIPNIQKLSENKKMYWKLYKTLKEKNKLYLLPEHITRDKIALSLLAEHDTYMNLERDTAELLSVQKAQSQHKSHEIYFFKTTSINPFTQIELPKVSYVALEVNEDGSFKISDTDNEVFIHTDIEYLDEDFLKETYKREIDRVLFYDKKRVNFATDYSYNIGF